MSGVVVELLPRLLRRPIRLSIAETSSIEVRAYTRAVIRDDVCVSKLVRALASHGLTFSNDPDLGLVIHPMPASLDAS
jgi:hypothetical protein